VTGIAGFPNGDIERVGSPQPEAYVARLFLRETVNLGCATEHVPDGPNQVEGDRSVDRLTFQFGKMSATDVFDSNAYSHDPRMQFMNWSLMDFGAWDYPADTRGYAPGLTAEWNHENWALRYGAFMVPKRANAAIFDWKIGRALGQALEFERRYKLYDRPGAARILAFDNNAHMGLYRDAIDNAGNFSDAPANSAPVLALFQSRAYRSKYGFGLNAEQEIFKDFGGFLRASWNDGRTETWMFTEIDRSFSAGVTMKGSRWGRPEDVIGFAGVINGLSNDHRDFLKIGGNGFIVGDGRLSYSPEKIIETYYKLSVSENLFITTDYQYVDDPAYNQDRGPVSIFGARIHLEF
jgi:high affinity Mn2+ porin